MLLVSDGAPLRRRRDECILDCRPGDLRAFGKNYSCRALAGVNHRPWIDGMGGLVDGGNTAVIIFSRIAVFQIDKTALIKRRNGNAGAT